MENLLVKKSKRINFRKQSNRIFNKISQILVKVKFIEAEASSIRDARKNIYVSLDHHYIKKNKVCHYCL